MAKELPKDGKLISLEVNSHHARIARKNLDRAGIDEQVDISVGRAVDLLPLLESEGIGPFDLIFIDADKPSYTEYFEWALRLSRKGTLIIADNVIREAKVSDQNSPDENVQGALRTVMDSIPKTSLNALIMGSISAFLHFPFNGSRASSIIAMRLPP